MPWEAPWPHDLRKLIVRLTKIRQQLVAVRDLGLSWQAYTPDGLIGRAPGVVVVLNRSRRKTFLLETQVVAQVGWETDGALIGTYQGARHALSPQSAVVFQAQK
jgi:neopullulanase